MSTRELLRQVVYFEIVIAVASVVLLFGVVAIRSLRRSRYEEPMRRAQEALGRVIAGEEVGTADRLRVRALPARRQVRLFAGVATHLTGESRRRVSEFGRGLAVAETAVRLCESRRWYRRLRGVRLCTLLRVGHDTVPRLLHDPRFAVRAEAVGWLSENPTEVGISTLVGFLANPAYVGGYALRDALLRIGAPVLPHLLGYLEAHAGKEAIPALDVALGIPSPDLSPIVHRLTFDETVEVRARAATLLAAIGGSEATERVLALLDDPAPEVQAAAITALSALNAWQSAPRIGRALRSRHWGVRSAAAVALRRLGAPGRLILQRGLGDEDAFAADMARQVLDLPAGVLEAEAWG